LEKHLGYCQSHNKTKNVCEDFTFAMMIKQVVTSFVGGSKGSKTWDFGAILRFKPLICLSVPTKLAEKVHLGVLQHPLNIKPKVWHEKLIWEKNQDIHEVAQEFSGSVFARNFREPVR